MECPTEHWRSEGRYRGRLDLGVELLVVGAEPLIVTAVSRFGSTVDGDDQAGADVGATSYTTD